MKSQRLSHLILRGGAALALMLAGGAVHAQTAAESCLKPWYSVFPPPVKSAEVLPDGRVTFRICAPQAKEVFATSSDAANVIPMGFPPPARLRA